MLSISRRISAISVGAREGRETNFKIQIRFSTSIASRRRVRYLHVPSSWAVLFSAFPKTRVWGPSMCRVSFGPKAPVR